MAKLTEVEYEKIFSPKTMAGLKGKSGESLRSMLGNKDLMQTLMKSKAILDELIKNKFPDLYKSLDALVLSYARNTKITSYPNYSPPKSASRYIL